MSLRESVILSESEFAGFLKDGFFSYQVHTGISGTTFPAPKVEILIFGLTCVFNHTVF